MSRDDGGGTYIVNSGSARNDRNSVGSASSSASRTRPNIPIPATKTVPNDARTAASASPIDVSPRSHNAFAIPYIAAYAATEHASITTMNAAYPMSAGAITVAGEAWCAVAAIATIAIQTTNAIAPPISGRKMITGGSATSGR